MEEAPLCPWDSPSKNAGVGCYSFLHFNHRALGETAGRAPVAPQPIHRRARPKAAARERSGGPVRLHVCRPHSSCCKQHRLTQRLMLSSMRFTVTLSVALLQASSTRLTLSGASSWTAWPHWGRTCIWNFPGEDINQSHLKD